MHAKPTGHELVHGTNPVPHAPEPVSATGAGTLPVIDVRVSVAVWALVADGVNRTRMLQVVPIPIMFPQSPAAPVSHEKPDPVTATARPAGTGPVFDKMNVKSLVEPMTTVPKSPAGGEENARTDGQPSLGTPLQLSSLPAALHASLAAGRILQAPGWPPVQRLVPAAHLPRAPNAVAQV
jgi:hypothetical protein